MSHNKQIQHSKHQSYFPASPSLRAKNLRHLSAEYSIKSGMKAACELGTKEEFLEFSKSQQTISAPIYSHPKTDHFPDLKTSSSHSPSKVRKKKRKRFLLAMITPENQLSEKETFFKENFNYNPQFVYKYPIKQKSLEKYIVSNKYLSVATKILNNVIRRYGKYDEFEELIGGKTLSQSEIEVAAWNYLFQEKLDKEISLRISPSLVPRACMSRNKNGPVLTIRSHHIREKWMLGLLRHEIGTHYMRSANNSRQPWHNHKSRQEMSLLPYNPTEEGLACLNSVIERPDSSLWRSALLYYTAFHAKNMSFQELFQDLGRFVKDPETRWDNCLRAKRVLTDTSLPGSFAKDQVYLTGALEILANRHKINFQILMKCGKISFKDIEFLKDRANLEKTRVPSFMSDLNHYKKLLDRVVKDNRLTDEDLNIS